MPQDKKMTFIGVADDQGRTNKTLNITATSPTIRSETHGNPLKAVYDIEIPVREATKLIGGIGERNFGKGWQQGNRVYDSDGVAATLTAQPCGRVAGYNAMYSVDVMVKEATSKGYAIARGGETQSTSQCRTAKQEEEESG